MLGALPYPHGCSYTEHWAASDSTELVVLLGYERGLSRMALLATFGGALPGAGNEFSHRPAAVLVCTLVVLVH